MSFGETFNIGGLVASVSNPTVTNVTSASGNEGTSLVHTVTLSAATTTSTNYTYSLSGGTATAGVDYTVPPTFSNGVTLSGSLTVPTAVSSFTVSVAAISDGSSESSETYNLTVGGVTGVGTISDAGSSLITPSISISSYSVIEGQGITLDATGTTAAAFTSNPFHDLKYRWVVNDGNTATHTYGLNPGTRLRNVIHGPIGGYICTEVGSFTVELQVGARLADGSLDYVTLTSSSITVQSANAAFPGTNTICIAQGATPVPGVNGVPSGADCYNYSTWSQVSGKTTTSNKRILLRRGDTWDSNVYTNTAADNILFGSYGSGANAIVSNSTSNAPFQLIGVDTWIFQDINFQGVSGGYVEAITTSGGGANITVNRCEVGFLGGISFAGVDGLYIGEVNGHDYQGGGGNVGIYNEYAYRTHIMGSRVYDATGIEHNIRMQGVQKFSCTNSTMYQAGLAAGGGKQLLTYRGWSQQETLGDPGLPTWSGIWAEHAYIADNDMDGGPSGTGMAVEFAPQNPGANEHIRTIIYECNFLHGLIGTGVGSEAISGVTIRNNLFDMYSDDTYPGSVIFPYSRNDYTSPEGSDHWVYGNSCYSRATTTNKFGFIDIRKDGPLDFPTFWARNNAVYAPFATSDLNSGGTTGKFFANSESAGSGYYDIANCSSDAQTKTTSPFATTPPTTPAHWAASGYAVNGGVYIKGHFEKMDRTPYTGTTRNMGAL